MCHQTSTNPSWMGIFPNFPPILWGDEEAGPHLGVHKGYSGFWIPPLPKMHFCASETLEYDNIPRDEEHGHALPGITVSWPHQVQLCAAAVFSRPLARPGYSRPPDCASQAGKWLLGHSQPSHPPGSTLLQLCLSLASPCQLPRGALLLRDESRAGKVGIPLVFWGFTPVHPQRCQVGSNRGTNCCC